MKKKVRYLNTYIQITRFQCKSTQIEAFLVDAFLNSESYRQAEKARNNIFILNTLRRLKRLARQPNSYFYTRPLSTGDDLL